MDHLKTQLLGLLHRIPLPLYERAPEFLSAELVEAHNGPLVTMFVEAVSYVLLGNASEAEMACMLSSQPSDKLGMEQLSKTLEDLGTEDCSCATVVVPGKCTCSGLGIVGTCTCEQRAIAAKGESSAEFSSQLESRITQAPVQVEEQGQEQVVEPTGSAAEAHSSEEEDEEVKSAAERILKHRGMSRSTYNNNERLAKKCCKKKDCNKQNFRRIKSSTTAPAFSTSSVLSDFMCAP